MNEKKRFRTLRLLATNECNLSCFYCCEEGHKSKYNHINSASIKKVLSTVNKYFDIERIKLTGGEPLYSDDIMSIIDTIHKAKNQNQIVSVVTNGVEVDRIQELVKYKDLDLTVSLPTLCEETFDFITQEEEGKLGNVRKSINLLIENNYAFKLNCVLVENVTNTEGNIREIVDTFGSHHNVEIRFLELSVNDMNRDAFNYDEYKPNISCFNDNMRQLGFQKCENTERRESVLYLNPKSGIRIKLIKFFCRENCNRCPETKSSLWISCDGYMTDCSFDSEKEIHFENFSSGDISRAIEGNESLLRQ